jgi:pteridine reductase
MAKAKERQRRVALVTGGAKRVGRAIVERFAREGFDVAFTYFLSAVEAEEVVRQFEGTASRVVRIPAISITRHVRPRRGRRVSPAFERLDVLVNNASAYEPSPLDSVTLDQIQRFNAVHIEAPLLLCQAFAGMLRDSKGHVINMVDLLAERPWPEYLAYCASKAGCGT